MHTDNIRVTHLVPALFGAHDGVVGGAERYALELARHMADVVPTELVTFGQEDRVESHGGLSIHVIGKPWFVRGQQSNPMSKRLFSRLRSASVVHCHQQHILASSAAALYSRISGRRVFVSDLGGGGWDISAYLSTDRWYHGHLHISEYSRKVFGHSDLPSARVILGGVDTDRFDCGNEAAGDAPALFVGRLLPHKGIDYLIEGLPQDMALEVVGRPYDRDFADRLKTLADGRLVTFQTDCSDDDLVAAYQRSCCVVLPSVYRTAGGRESKIPELLGQTALEGMACGRLAICTDVASLPEIVEDGKTGFLVPPNDPAAIRERLTWIRSHPDQARAMGRAAREAVTTRFTWPAVVNRCIAAYRGDEAQ